MSVINQLLMDLERRRAGPAERGALPSNVRALPEGEGAGWGWIAGGAAIAGGLIAAGWLLFPATEPAPVKPDALAVRSGTEIAIERVVTVSAGVARPVAAEERIERLLLEPPASRMSFELSTVPVEPAVRDAEPPVPQAARAPTASRTIRADAARDAVPFSANKTTVATTRRPEIRKEERPPTARALAENEYRKGAGSLQQGRIAEAQEEFRSALGLLPEHHGARQALIGLLVRGGQFDEAERLLQDGLRLAPAQTGFTVTLARLQVDRGANALAIATMQSGLHYAQGNPDYAAFLAALLQREGRHDDAIAQFTSALRAKPSQGVWWLGLGMSLQAVKRNTDAQEAYRRARAANNLHPELAALAEQRLKQLQ